MARKRFEDPDGDEGAYGKSRSQKKRESTALQARGAELAALSPARWRRLPLPPELLEALHEWRGLKTHEAKRRHMQYIGRLMRELDDPDPLLEALAALQAEDRGDAAALHRLEALRDALLQENESGREQAFAGAVAELRADEKRLRHLVEAAFADREKHRPPKHARELFRYLRQLADDAG